MFGMGIGELVIIFAIVLLMFGGKRLPLIATGLGSAIRNFKTSLKEENSLTATHTHVLPSDKDKA